MVSLLVILDGAPEQRGTGPTTLERADTPALDRLATEGTVACIRTIPEGLPAGSEVGIPVLLGLAVDERPSRGAIEAAAAGIEFDGQPVWRCDAPRSLDPREALAAGAQAGLIHVRGHRFVAVREAPRLPKAWHSWELGKVPDWTLDEDVVVIGGPGVAVGVARLAGARALVPSGATADVDTSLEAKAAAAVDALGNARMIVVHVAAPDEAAHRRDRDLKLRLLEAIDAQLIAPLMEAIAARNGVMRVAADHGTDPVSGRHLADVVPEVIWGHEIASGGPNRMVERARSAA